MVYTKTIFYLSVGESDGFLPSLFKSYCSLFVWDLLKSKTDISFNLELTAFFWESPIIQNPNIAFPSKFSIDNFSMRYNSELVQIKLVISGNSVVYEDIKITLGLFIFALINQAKLVKMAISSFTLRHDLIRHHVGLGKKSLINFGRTISSSTARSSELTNQGTRKALVTCVAYSANVHFLLSNNKMFSQRK